MLLTAAPPKRRNGTMNPSHDYRRREIATRDLLYRALRKWRLILVASLLAAIACAAFTLIKKSGGEEELTSEERTAYEKELDAYRRDLEVYPSVIGDSNALLANTRSYLSESLLTKLDPSHVGKAAAVVTLIPSSDEADSGNASLTAGQLADRSAAFITYGIDWSGLSEKLSVKPEYLAELVETVPSVGTARYVSPNAVGTPAVSEGTLIISVVHSDSATAALILEELLRQLQAAVPSMEETCGPHSAVTGDIESGYFADIIPGGRSEAIMQDMYLLTTSNEYLTEQYESLKAPARPDSVSGQGLFRRAVKTFFIALLGGIILITLIVMAVLSLSGKVLSGNELAQVTGLRKLAVIPDRKKLSGPLDRLIARLDTEQKNSCSKDLRYLAAAEAILAQTGSKASVLLIGHVGEDALDQCAADLRRAFQADNVSAVPEILSADLRDGMADGLRFLREAAGVVMVEEIEKSGYASITEELSALEARNTNLLGYILL